MSNLATVQGIYESFGKGGVPGPGMAEAGVAVEPQVTVPPAHEGFTPKSVKITT